MRERVSEKFQQLMQAAQSGDSRAYETLLKGITVLLRGFLAPRLGDRSQQEDVIQDILLGVHRSAHTYNTDRPFLPWLYAIANYKLKDHLRAHYRNGAQKCIDISDIEETLADSVTFQQHAGELLDEVLADLPDRQRSIVHLMKVEGHSAKEVAEEMQMSLSAVKVAAHRAYKFLIRKHARSKP